MGGPYRSSQAPDEPSETTIREAFRAWASGVFFAPKGLGDQITGITRGDEIVPRLATEIIRRDVVQRRGPVGAQAPRRSTLPNPAAVDPFVGSLDELRSNTEHAAACSSCGGSGSARCPVCVGAGRVTCRSCGGQGRTYEKSTRGAKCKACHETGKQPCGHCNETGKVRCDGCGGTRQQLVWLAWEESRRTVAATLGDSAICREHGPLREQRFLIDRDLTRFTPFVTLQRPCAIPTEGLDPQDVDAITRLSPAFDPRLERINAQQFLRFGVVRRDVQYEMCGVAGVVSLAGLPLLGVSNAAALRPIHRRVMALAATAVGLVVVALAWRSLFTGPTAYFANLNVRLVCELTLGVAAALACVGSALARLRPGGRWWPSKRAELVAGGVFLAAFGVAGIDGLVSRPTVASARAAIASGDLERAKVVVEALSATQTSEDVGKVGDELIIAEAGRLSGEARVAKLDEAGASRAGAAREEALRARVGVVQSLLSAHEPTQALSDLDRWKAELAGAPEARELRAQAFDQEAAACTDEACGFLAARSADEASTSPERAQARASKRQRILTSLDPKVVSEQDPVVRLRGLSRTRALASRIRSEASDPQLVENAAKALSFVEAETGKIALVGASAAVVDDVLARPSAGSPLTGWPDLAGVAVYCANSAGQCAGLYVVGVDAGHRSLSGKEPGLAHLVAQATGRRLAKMPAASSTKANETSKWNEGSTPIVARWNGAELMELRIGSASP